MIFNEVFTTELHAGNDPATSDQNTNGSIVGNWLLSGGSRLQATYADLAEKYIADDSYEPGTVVVLGGEKDVTVTNQKDDHRVAGVVSTNPAFIMNEDAHGEHIIDIALQGRVPCKVIGVVHKGDLLVSSAMPGYAMVNNDAKTGRVIGKSLENKDSNGTGVIEIMVGRT